MGSGGGHFRAIQSRLGGMLKHEVSENLRKGTGT